MCRLVIFDDASGKPSHHQGLVTAEVDTRTCVADVHVSVLLQ